MTTTMFRTAPAPTHHTSNVAQEELGKRFVDKESCPPSSPDCLPLNYYFWNKVKQKVYGGRRLPFKDLKELGLKIKQVWRECCDIDELRKALIQFRPRLKEVVRQEGGPTKHIYG